MKKTWNNNYWQNQYSHKVAKVTYSKKAPSDLKDKVMELATNICEKYNHFTIENIAKTLNVLHKHVHKVIMEEMRNGNVKVWRYKNLASNDFPNGLHYQTPIEWFSNACHDNARHPKIYSIVKK
jgi:hypothetical protein